MNFKQTSSLILGALILSTSAMAGNLQMEVGDQRRLTDCGGTVELNGNDNGQVNLVFRNVENCSNFDILSANGSGLDYPNQKLGGGDRNRSGSFTLPKSIIDEGRNSVRVVIKSNSGKTSDVITARILLVVDEPGTIRMGLGQYANLNQCGGTVEANKTYNGNRDTVTLVFRNVAKCSNFDILGANGEQIDYENKKLGGNDGNRSGSFTLPSSLIDHGRNSVLVVVKSNSGKTSNKIRLSFRAY